MLKNKNHSKISRQIYFDKSVHLKPVKDCISGKNELAVIKSINFFGYRLGQDFYRQYPIASKFVLDIAFPKEQVAIEVDGESHKAKKQKKLDKQRDSFLKNNNWVVIRVLDEHFRGYKGLFYKNLINEVVLIRRRQLLNGELLMVELPDFRED